MRLDALGKVSVQPAYVRCRPYRENWWIERWLRLGSLFTLLADPDRHPSRPSSTLYHALRLRRERSKLRGRNSEVGTPRGH